MKDEPFYIWKLLWSENFIPSFIDGLTTDGN